ncbi:MAG: flagellar basal body P-ring formation chaperone FlgA [Acetobacteraceae bacterium]|jgi:flagellar basal body P-ring formation protein FlgA
MIRLPFAVLAICLVGTTAQSATLRTVTTLHAPTVRLSDLFEDAGANANRVLGPGPGAGGRIVVEAAQLGAIARQFGVDWRPASSADRAVLDRPGRPLPREDVLDALRSALIEGGTSPDCDIELADFSPPLVPFESNPRPVVSDLSYDTSAGRFTAMLSVAGDSMEPIYMRLAGKVDDTIEVPVATARLPAGSVLRAEDVHVARVHTSLIHGEVVHRIEDAVGMQTKRQIAGGAPLVGAELMRPSMVQKGATVLMMLDSPGIALTAQGQAMEAGAIGERIRILNPVSHAVVEAEVTGPDRVRVAPSAMPLNVSVR